ncbi:hypothetical protein [Sporomusa carbonis]|uniref:hypothetical protein n=1 Tax=Sporomusa carbonis TaxID=3076075 RepID=UPI003C7D2965
MKETQGITPEIIAAISASIGIMLGDTGTEFVTTATAGNHVKSNCLAIRIKRTNNFWMIAGRQKLMNNRL